MNSVCLSSLILPIRLLLLPLPAAASLETFKRIEFSEEFIEDACCCSCFYNKCDIKSQQVNSDQKYLYQEVEMAVVVEIEFARDNSITFVFASLNLMYYTNQIITVGRRGKFNFIEIAWRLFPWHHHPLKRSMSQLVSSERSQSWDPSYCPERWWGVMYNILLFLWFRHLLGFLHPPFKLQGIFLQQLIFLGCAKFLMGFTFLILPRRRCRLLLWTVRREITYSFIHSTLEW